MNSLWSHRAENNSSKDNNNNQTQIDHHRQHHFHHHLYWQEQQQQQHQHRLIEKAQTKKSLAGIPIIHSARQPAFFAQPVIIICFCLIFFLSCHDGVMVNSFDRLLFCNRKIGCCCFLLLLLSMQNAQRKILSF